ncbi:hypothetical protein NCWK1_3634 [Nostoc cycadae WK-1]|uniref:Uncharacterized protein n=1 Tax=Nostoc cycadae WK-1 TaxID=1861711 RepID=A0A2H6LKX2_9NOSO|nr:hypothetical protein NCWK1_3634 [Nostoc cycadae WK-1]
MLSAGVDTATVRKLQPSRYDDANPWVYHEVTKVVPVSQPPSARKAQGNNNIPDQPTNTKRSRFNQSSSTSNHPLLLGARPTAMVIGLKSSFY